MSFRMQQIVKSTIKEHYLNLHLLKDTLSTCYLCVFVRQNWDKSIPWKYINYVVASPKISDKDT